MARSVAPSGVHFRRGLNFFTKAINHSFIHLVLNKFLWASVRRCFRKFLKNTGRFQPCPLDVLESFLKTQGGFRAARWVLLVDGRFRLSADSFRLFASTTLNHKTQNRFPFNWRHKPFLRFSFCGCFVVRIFSWGSG